MGTLSYSVSMIISIIFGIVAMMILLDVQIPAIAKPKNYLFFIGIFMVLALNFAVMLKFGMAQQGKYYMLLVHLPLAILFWKITKIHPIKIIFTLFTAVFLIFPANLISNLTARLNIEHFQFLSTLYFLATSIFILFLTKKFFKRDFNYLIKHYNNRSFLKLFFLPLIYNISIYWVGKYHYSITTTIDSLILRCLFFLIALTAYFLVFDISRTNREKQTMKHDQLMLSLQLESANQQMQFLRASQEQTAIYRHDMRHHLTLISGLAAGGDIQKVKEYVSDTIYNIDAIAPTRYCGNETVNLILSSFNIIAQKNHVTLHTEVKLPQELHISDTELCSLFSNTLENAITSAAKITVDKLRTVYIRALINDNKLIISTENAYLGKIEMEGELPKSQNNSENHGFGIKSIVTIVEKHGGLYSFETANGIFILQLMLPLCDPSA